MGKVIFIFFGLTIGFFAAKTMMWLLTHPGETLITMLVIFVLSGIATFLRMMLGR